MQTMRVNTFTYCNLWLFCTRQIYIKIVSWNKFQISYDCAEIIILIICGRKSNKMIKKQYVIRDNIDYINAIMIFFCFGVLGATEKYFYI